MVNAHHSQTLAEAFERNPFIGTLGAGQGSDPIRVLAVVLSDDSPEDGQGGAALFAHDIIITAEDFDTKKRTKFRLREVVADPTKWPVITGGFPREGFLAADGEEQIVINYDFTDLAYIGPRPTEIIDIQFDLRGGQRLQDPGVVGSPDRARQFAQPTAHGFGLGASGCCAVRCPQCRRQCDRQFKSAARRL